MKKRVAPILTLTLAMILVGGLAYAAKKKDLEKPADQEPTHEEEALQAELLEATVGHQDKLPNNVVSSTKIVAERYNAAKEGTEATGH